MNSRHHPHPNPSRSPAPNRPVPADRTRFDPDRVLERRRASRELDALLGVRGYPDLAVTYGLHAIEEAS